MSNLWKRNVSLALLVLAGCGSVENSGLAGPVGSGSSLPLSQVQSKSAELNFAEIAGELSDGQPSRTHTLQFLPGQFRLPSGKALIKLTLEHERGQSVVLRGPAGFSPIAEGLLGVAESKEPLEFEVTGRGSYRVLVSLAGDFDGDGDVDGSDSTAAAPSGMGLQVADLNGDGRLDGADGDIARQNLGASTSVRPLALHAGLDPSQEPFAHLGETLNAKATLLVRSNQPGVEFDPSGSEFSEIDAKGLVSPQSAPFVQLIRSNLLGFSAPAIAAAEALYEEFWAVDVAAMVGYHGLQFVAQDNVGQRVEASALVERLEQPSETPARLSEDKRNRIWLLDVHANNYLFRGPLPLTTLEEDGQVDFAALVHVMNQRMQLEGAPLSTLPAEFKFTEIVLITNRATKSASHGDEGFALHHIYKTILGSEPPWPEDDAQDPTSVFTGPLDNKVVEGTTFSQVVDGKNYTIHPSVTWQPVSANSTGEEPTTLEGGVNGYKTVIRSTFPIVSIAPNPSNPQRQLSNELSNVSVATRYIHQLMQPDHSQDVPHIFYLHCVNGHDRTGMLATTYVLSAYGKSFNYNLATAYKYGQMGSYLPEYLPNGIASDRNFWDKLESDGKNTGRLKKKYMQAVQALAFLYHHPDGAGIQSAPPLTTTVPAVPLWQAGYTFADAADSPIEKTPPDYLHVRP